MPKPKLNVLPVDTTGFAGRADSIMNANKHVRFVQRALDPNRETLPLEDGNYGTHKMSYASDSKGDFSIYPHIVETAKGLENLPAEKAMKRAYSSDSNRVNVGNDADFAEYMSQVGYKRKFPIEDKKKAMSDYVNFLLNK